MANGNDKLTRKEAKQPAPITRQERMRYNQYVKKQMRSGGTPAGQKAWLKTQRGK